MCEIIGRKKEIAELKRYYESSRAEFVAILWALDARSTGNECP